MLKIILPALLTITALIATPALAAEIPEVKQDTYVYDAAEIISEEAESTLNQSLLTLELQTSAELFVVTVPGLNGEPLEDFSIKVANTMGIGQKEYNNGLLLLVSPPENTRNVRIEVGRGMEGIFNDAKAGRILDQYFVPSREKGDYQTAIIETTNQLISETTANAEWVGKPAEAHLQEALPFLISVPLFFLAIITLNCFSAYRIGKKSSAKGKKDLKFWAIMALGFSIMNSNRSRHGGFFGGGFGGGGSGGGGGFSGGGSFGGGGASR